LCGGHCATVVPSTHLVHFIMCDVADYLPLPFFGGSFDHLFFSPLGRNLTMEVVSRGGFSLPLGLVRRPDQGVIPRVRYTRKEGGKEGR